MSLIDRAFLNQLIENKGLRIDIKRTSLIKIRGLNIKEYDVCEYVIILMYILSSNGEKIVLIRWEIHIVDDLFAKALIEIDIMKLESIVLDTNKDLVIIGSCNSLQVSMFIMTKDSRIDAVVLVKAQFSIPSMSFLAVSVKDLNLSFNRDLIFESD